MAGVPIHPVMPDGQPDFPEMGNAFTTLSANMQRLGNIPGVQDHLGIAQALHQLTIQMNQRFNQMDQRFTDIQQTLNASERGRRAMVANRIPIQQNKHRADTNVELIPLQSHLTNQIPADFPLRLSDVTQMPAATVNRLLEAYEQSTDGNLAERRQRLKMALGSRAVFL